VVCVNRTRAPGTTEPEESRTVPDTWEVETDCPCTEKADIKIAKTAQ